MKRLFEFFEGESGGLSMTRLLAAYTTVMVMTLWGINSYRSGTLQKLDSELVVIVLGATGMVQLPKVIPKKKETQDAQ